MPTKLDESQSSLLSKLLAADPPISYVEIARQVGCSRSMVTKQAAAEYRRRHFGRGHIPQQVIKQLYLKGKGVPAIGQMLHVPPSTVRRVLLDLGVQFRGKGPVPLMTPERLQTAVEMAKRGLRITEITRRLQDQCPELTYATVRAALSRVLE